MTWDTLNLWLAEQCRKRQTDVLRGHIESIGQRLARDLDAMMDLPAAPFDACDQATGQVNSQSLVRYKTNDYSVPVAYGHRDVWVRAYVDQVVIGCGGDVIAHHPRCWDREDMVFDPVHYLPLLEQKTGTLDQAAPLAGWDLPEEFATLRRLMEARMIKAGRCEYVRQYNRRFLQMCSHYLVQPVACTPASGWGKGQVENQVGLIRERFFTPRLRVKSLDELNAWLMDKCVAYAKAHRHPEETDKSIWEVFEAERLQLVRYVGRFDGFHSVPASVSKTCTVRFDNNKYSVLATAAGRPAEVHAYAERIIIRQDGVVVGEHALAFGRGQTVYIPWHYAPVLARKPGALRNGAQFRDWVLPQAMAAVRRELKGSDDGDRQMVQILSCGRDDGLQAVQAACREALDQGVHSAPVIIDILARSKDAAPPPLLLTPASLRLTHAPVADCARYDSLRRTSRHGTHPNPRPDEQPQALRDAQCL